MKLKLYLIGKSEIEYNGEKIRLKLRKAEGMLYYIALNKEVTRDALKAAFWPDKNEAQAAANLRNALYLINDALPGVLSVDRRNIAVYDFKTDMDEYESIADPNVKIPDKIYEPPLCDIYAHGDMFCEWLEIRQNTIKDKIAELIKQRVAAAYELQDNGKIRDALIALQKLDPFDEDSMLELMELYAKTKNTRKAAELYLNYTSALSKKFAVSPSERAKKYYAKLIRENASGQRKTFFCREKELALISEKLTEDAASIIFIHGEVGIGKSSLINEATSMLSEDGALVFQARATPIGEPYAYSAWNNILRELRDVLKQHKEAPDKKRLFALAGIFPCFVEGEALSFNDDISHVTDTHPVALALIISDLVAVIAQKRRVLFVFEDIHWFDAKSVELLFAFISQSPSADIIISGRPESARLSTAMLKQAKCGRLVTEIRLEPFRRDEISYICHSVLPETIISEHGISYFIDESGGIPLLLFEMFRALEENPKSDCTKGLGGLIVGRMRALACREQEVLNAVAVCAGGTPRIIAKTARVSTEEALACAEKLISMGLLYEREEGANIFWDFTHQKLRDCVYERIRAAKRKELHRLAGEALREIYSPRRWNPALGVMLRRHYERSGDKVSDLKLCLNELIFDIALNHDIFPILTNELFLSCSAPFSDRGETEKKLSHAVSVLDELRGMAALSDCEFARLEAVCFELTGGYRVNWGEYEDAAVYIEESMRISKRFGFIETQMHCLKHYAYMYLQTENADKLIITARVLLRLAKDASSPHYFATAVRFIGMGYVMKGKDKTAEKIFLYSVKLFEQMQILGKNYTLGKLVAKCYLGEIYGRSGDFSKAAELLSECAATCDRMNLYWGRSYFHTCAANIALDAGNNADFFRHTDKAVALFESCRGGRCSALLYSTKAIADAARNDIKSAEEALGKSAALLRKIARKEWLSAHTLAKAYIKREKGEDFKADAANALRQYKKIGFYSRAAWIAKRFNITT